jgi:hypothetical protein
VQGVSSAWVQSAKGASTAERCLRNSLKCKERARSDRLHTFEKGVLIRLAIRGRTLRRDGNERREIGAGPRVIGTGLQEAVPPRRSEASVNAAGVRRV